METIAIVPATVIPSRFANASHASSRGGFTLVEVMVAVGLVVLGLVGIYTMQAQGMQLVRGGRNVGAASQVLQQRAEQLRATPYATLTTSAGLLGLMSGTAGAMSSERHFLGAQNIVETVTVYPYYRPSVTPPATLQTFTVTRTGGGASGPATASNLSAQAQVKAHLRVLWDDRQGSHQREFTTVLSNGGLSAAGISKKP